MEQRGPPTCIFRAAALRLACSPPAPPESPSGAAASITASHTSQWNSPSPLMSLKASSVVASRRHQSVVQRKCCSGELRGRLVVRAQAWKYAASMSALRATTRGVLPRF